MQLDNLTSLVGISKDFDWFYFDWIHGAGVGLVTWPETGFCTQMSPEWLLLCE